MGWWENIKREGGNLLNDLDAVVEKAGDDIDGTSAKKYGVNREAKNQQGIADDKKKFEKFKNQDFLDPNAELYTPSYSKTAKYKQEQEAMLSLFNARKDEILAGQRTPGINQTRF